MLDSLERRARTIADAFAILNSQKRDEVSGALVSIAESLAAELRFELIELPELNGQQVGALARIAVNLAPADLELALPIIRQFAHVNKPVVCESMISMLNSEKAYPVPIVLEVLVECGADFASVAIRSVSRFLTHRDIDTRRAASGFLLRFCDECRAAFPSIMESFNESDDEAVQDELMLTIIKSISSAEECARELFAFAAIERINASLRRLGVDGRLVRRQLMCFQADGRTESGSPWSRPLSKVEAGLLLLKQSPTGGTPKQRDAARQRINRLIANPSRKIFREQGTKFIFLKTISRRVFGNSCRRPKSGRVSDAFG